MRVKPLEYQRSINTMLLKYSIIFLIGQRLADGVALQKDMELVGVADVAPTLAVRALKEKGMPYKFYNALPENSELL